MILVTGAAGKSGQVVVRALAARGATVRALVHRAEQVALAQRLGAAEVTVGDLADPASLAAALDGVRAVYHVPPAVLPNEAELGLALLDAARAAGVYFIFHSVMHPQISALPHHAHKLRVEDALIQSGLPFTILQPASYMQNMLESWPRIEQGVYPVLYGLHAPMSLVDLEDVAAVAARVLTESGHEGATYELSGPQTLDGPATAAILSAALGHPVVAEEVPLDVWETRARTAIGPERAATLATMFRYYHAHGFTGNPRVLEMLLGRPATDFAAFVRRVVG